METNIIPAIRYRLDTIADIEAFINIGGEEFREYYRAFREFARKMQEDCLFDYQKEIPEELQEQFIKTAMVYIVYEQEECIVFTDDYMFIRKLSRRHWDRSSSKKTRICQKNNEK